MDKVVHFEVPVDNMSRAQKFYKNVFGWKIENLDMPEDMDYAMLYTTEIDKKRMPKTPGAINGGMMKKDKTASYPIITVDVKSIDNAIKKIEKAGGKVVLSKMNVMDMGWYARFKDTERNTLAVWQTIPKKA